MDIRKFLRGVLDGNSILFLGAGFSVGAKNILDTNFLIGEGLCKKLILDGRIDVSEDSERDLQDLGYVSGLYLENNTKRDLIRLLKDNYTCKEVSENQLEIAKANWKRVYTTNYDDIMEYSSKSNGKLRDPIVMKDRIGDIYGKDNAVIHINGYIGELNEETLESEFKLTSQSYRQKSISDSDWAIALFNDIENADCVIFIGYSLNYDLELQQIFAANTKLKEKCLFVTYNPSKREEKTMRLFGDLYVDGLVGFCNELKNFAQGYETKERLYNYGCLKVAVCPHKVNTSIVSKDIIDLFVTGNVQNSIVYSSLNDEYIFERDCTSMIIDFLKKEGKVAILHADLANGKTVVLKQLEKKLITIGNVYYLNKLNSKYADDIEQIASLPGNHFVIFEDYNQFMDYREWKDIKKYRFSNIKYIFTARSYINDNFFYRVLEDFELNNKEIQMYDLNVLSEVEIKCCISILDKYNVWGKKSTLSPYGKKKYIEKECSGGIRNILLDLYSSPQIKSKIDELIKVIIANDNLKNVLLMSFISNIMSLNLSFSDICLILNNNINLSEIKQVREFNEFVLIENNKIYMKSSVISTYILQNGDYNKDVLFLLCKMVEVLSIHSYNSKYKSLLRLIISFSSVRLVFNRKEKDISKEYITFYENARKSGFYNNNPFFWVQYALAVMEVKDYEMAEIFLNNASAFSKDRYSEDSYQIESLKARLILERTIYNKAFECAFKNFLEAHKLICSNKTPEKHYPFKQAKKYITFYKLFYSSFSKDERVKFMYSCMEIKGKMDEYLLKQYSFEKNFRKKSNEIRNISMQLKEIISKMGSDK